MNKLLPWFNKTLFSSGVPYRDDDNKLVRVFIMNITQLEDSSQQYLLLGL